MLSQFFSKDNFNMDSPNRFYVHFACTVLALGIALLGCSCARKPVIESENGYVSLVEIGRKAQGISPIGTDAKVETRKLFVAANENLIEELKIVLQKRCYVKDELRPHTYEEHGRDTFLHFKPLAALLRESCRLAIDEKNTVSVMQNAFLLINLGKSICYGGDRDDQNMGFVFMTQGVVLLYQYLHTQPDDLDDSVRHLFINMTKDIESASVTVSQLPKSSAIHQYETLRERSIEIQTNRISAIYACFGMCRIAFELELYRKASGKYPKSLLDIQCINPLPLDPWSAQSFVYIRPVAKHVFWL
ncbi:hypothetical protein FACS189454_09670 [Planctomycetales bacterium]|nr:hypothetical protein FACS189454_09670 [Planctomycetales bacterium]